MLSIVTILSITNVETDHATLGWSELIHCSHNSETQVVKVVLINCLCLFTSAVTFPAAEHHRPLTGTKLYYCLVTEAQRHMCGVNDVAQ